MFGTRLKAALHDAFSLEICKELDVQNFRPGTNPKDFIASIKFLFLIGVFQDLFCPYVLWTSKRLGNVVLKSKDESLYNICIVEFHQEVV